jgi:enoyl-CoA hydratase/carnithine racemase
VRRLSDYKDSYRYYRLDRTPEGVLTVTFHADGGPMVWGIEQIEELGALWAEVGADRDNKVVIVTGTGDEFIARMSVSSGISGEIWDRIASGVRRMVRNHLAIEVPMIAAVNGPALFHSEQALLCDLTIAGDTAVFQDSPHFTAGMVPGDGVQILYHHLIGGARARYFHYMGEKIPAKRALEIGLISEVHPPGALLGRAEEMAAHILSQPELVRRYTRQVTMDPIRRLYAGSLDHGLALEGLGALASWSHGS